MCMCDLSWIHILNWNINMKHATCLVKIWTENMLNMVHFFLVAAMLVSFYWIWISSKHQYDEKSDLVYKFVVLCYVLSIKWLVLSFLSNLNVLITVKWLLMFFSIKFEQWNRFILALFNLRMPWKLQGMKHQKKVKNLNL